MINIKTFLAFLALISSCIGCKMTIQEADQCGMKAMFFGNRNTLIPTNDQELDQHCGVIFDSIKCLREFTSDCLEGYVQQVFNMGLKSSEQHLNRRCKDPKDRNDFLSHVKCLMPKEKMEPFHICTDKYLVMMEKLKEVAAQDRIPASCCIFHSFQECIRKNNKQICGDDASNYWDDIINEDAGDWVSLSCANYETIDKCEKSLNPKVWNELKSITASDDPKILAQGHKLGSGVAISIEIMKQQ